MEKKRKKSGSKSRFKGFFRIRKKTPKSGKVIESKRDKEKEKRVKHRDLIKEVEEN
ncbi:MAG: hypothetical protein ACM3SR_09650 [Ignavibacteriales bacterium]